MGSKYASIHINENDQETVLTILVKAIQTVKRNKKI